MISEVTVSDDDKREPYTPPPPPPTDQDHRKNETPRLPTR